MRLVQGGRENDAELTEMTPVNLEFTPGGYKNLIHPIYTKWPQKNKTNFRCVRTTSRTNDRTDNK